MAYSITKIFDCFPFFNEVDLCVARLEYLHPHVEKFIICEANFTHAGLPKPYIFEENQELFKKFEDKIIYVKLDYSKTKINNSWELESVQRNELFKHLPNTIRRKDLIMISDLDEIPNVDKIPSEIGAGSVLQLIQLSRFYFADCRRSDMKYWFGGTKVVAYETIQDQLLDEKFVTYGETFLKELNIGATATKIRLYQKNTYVKDGGWHFSYLGGAERIRTKLISFSHQEIPTKLRTLQHIQSRLSMQRDVLSDNRLYYGEAVPNGFAHLCYRDAIKSRISLRNRVVTSLKLEWYISKQMIKRLLIYLGVR